MGWKVNLWARLLDGNHAYKLIKDQINPAIKPNGEEHGGTYPNMLDAHPPFQIDGNFGCTAGIAEMLMQSHDGFIYILPALPDDWEEGSVSGLQARGDFEVDISWEDEKVKTFTIHSGSGGNCRIRTLQQIEALDDAELHRATGNNTNPFYPVKNVKEAEISPRADIEKPDIRKTYLYDLSTRAGETYRLGISTQ